MRDAHAAAACTNLLADAAREFVEDAGGDSVCEPDNGREVAEQVWARAALVSEISLWTATFGFGIGGALCAAEGLEELAMPLGELVVVRCAFSLLSFAARAVSLMTLEREGWGELVKPRENLREASLSLASWLFTHMNVGCPNEDGVVSKMFDVLGDCWVGIFDMEEHILQPRTLRAWHVDSVQAITAKVNCIRNRLVVVGVLEVAAGDECLALPDECLALVNDAHRAAETEQVLHDECIQGHFQPRDGTVLAEAIVGDRTTVWSLAALGDGSHFVSGSADNVVRLHDSSYLNTVLALRGHEKEVHCVEVARRKGARNSFLIFSGSYDNTVRCWEVDLNGRNGRNGATEKANYMLSNCGSMVCCLSVSHDGNVVAAGCGNGLVFVWKLSGESSELCYDVVTSFKCADPALDLREYITGVIVSKDGNMVVACGNEGNIVFWGQGDSRKSGHVVDRFADESDAELLWDVFLSTDESSLVVVFDEPAGYEIWDIASRKKRSSRVSLPGFKFVTCASFSCEKDAAGNPMEELLVGGWEECSVSNRATNWVIDFTTQEGLTVRSSHSVSSIPKSLCRTTFGGKNQVVVGGADGYVRILDANVSVVEEVEKAHCALKETVGAFAQPTRFGATLV